MVIPECVRHYANLYMRRSSLPLIVSGVAAILILVIPPKEALIIVVFTGFAVAAAWRATEGVTLFSRLGNVVVACESVVLIVLIVLKIR